MRRITLTIIVLTILNTVIYAQIIKDPVTWTYKVIKIDKNFYKITLTAIILKDWHIYSQIQPIESICTPTSFKIEPNVFKNDNRFWKEIGIKEFQKVESLGISQYFYSGSVKFNNDYVLTNKSKRTVSITASYMACNDEICLPIKETTIRLILN